MLMSDGRVCPICGGPGQVYRTVQEFRYRKCQDTLCKGRWRTQEVYQREADEITELATRVRDFGPSAVRELLQALHALDTLLNPGYIPIEEEATDELAERELTAA